MVPITIRDLHMKTGAWVRKAALTDGIIIMDRRRPVAKLVSLAPEDSGRSFGARRLVKGFSELPMSSDDSARYLEEDRAEG